MSQMQRRLPMRKRSRVEEPPEAIADVPAATEEESSTVNGHAVITPDVITDLIQNSIVAVHLAGLCAMWCVNTASLSSIAPSPIVAFQAWH